MESKLLSPVEVAARLGVTVAALSAMRCRKCGPEYVKIGVRRVRYRLEDVEKYIKSAVVVRGGQQ